MLEYYTHHNMVNCINDLHERHETMSRDDVRKFLSQWDNDQGRAMQHSEKCLLRPRKKWDWSQELRNSSITRRYWLLRLRETSRNESYLPMFHRWQDRICLQDAEFTLPFLGQPQTPPEIREHFCTTLYRASISIVIQYTLLLESTGFPEVASACA
jgi:hypothetical protein